MTDVLSKDVDKVVNAGRPIKTGDRSDKFQGFLKSIGFDKESLLTEFEEAASSSDLVSRMKKRYLALKMHEAMVESTVDLYNNANKRILALTTQLQEIDAKIKVHEEDMLAKDPTYSPINDKNLLKWTELRVKLMDTIRKQQMELSKMALDKDSDVKADEIDWSSI